MPTTASGGWTGKTLRVDLTNRKVIVENTLEKFGDFWGGTGLAYKVLWDEVPASVEPWDAENRLIFGWGPLVGTGTPCAGRTAVISLWPGNPNHSVAHGHMGGYFSAEAKFAGWDSIIVQGKASNPVYISIIDDRVDIVDCPELWGNGIYRATQQISAAMGPRTQVAAIGQAGENLVIQSNVMTGNSHSAGVCGSIMGSKNLKAIGVLGTGRVKIATSKQKWRTLIENCMSIISTTYTHVIPSTPQPWAEYWYNGSWWKANKGSFWGAASPPVETGICTPDDRQSIGLRTNIPTRYFTALANDYTVRMEGCHACPLRCHIAVHVPSVERYGGGAHTVNTCVGVWLSGLRTWGTTPEDNRKELESRVLGVQLADDAGIWTHYSQQSANFKFLMGSDKGVSRIKPNVDDAEWADLTKKNGLIDLYTTGDPNWMRIWVGMVVNKTGELGKALGGSVVEWTRKWGLEDAYNKDYATVKHWGSGIPQHHGLDYSHIGALSQTAFNMHCQVHSWCNWYGGGLPEDVTVAIVERAMSDAGYPAGSGEGVDHAHDHLKPIDEAKIRLAKLAVARAELHNALGVCNWSYPWWASPSKERGYVGDLSAEAKLYSAVTGDVKNAVQLDREGERFWILQRCLTIRKMNSKDMRHLHDALPPWAYASFQGKVFGEPGHYFMGEEDWEKTLDLWYDAWGFDRATGAPTRATLESYGMKSVADQLASLGLLP